MTSKAKPPPAPRGPAWGGITIETLGVKDPELPSLARYSDDALARELGLRGYDVKIMQPAPDLRAKRLAKLEKKSPRRIG